MTTQGAIAQRIRELETRLRTAFGFRFTVKFYESLGFEPGNVAWCNPEPAQRPCSTWPRLAPPPSMRPRAGTSALLKRRGPGRYLLQIALRSPEGGFFTASATIASESPKILLRMARMYLEHCEDDPKEVGPTSSPDKGARNVELFGEKERLLISVVRSLVSAIEAKDVYTCGHSERVALFSQRLGGELGLSAEACKNLYLAGLLHDVGKIGVSDAILSKPTQLTTEQYDEIKRHPDLGWSILQDFEQLRYVLPGVVHHHERIDGTGYPDGLAGAQIPLDGRILAVVDAYDAMTSDRPYRRGMPLEQAIDILLGGAGTQWDGEVVQAFVRILPEILQLGSMYQHPKRSCRASGAVTAAGHAIGSTAIE